MDLHYCELILNILHSAYNQLRNTGLHFDLPKYIKYIYLKTGELKAWAFDFQYLQ